MWLDVACCAKKPVLKRTEQFRLWVERKTVDRLNQHEFGKRAADGNFVCYQEFSAIDRAPDERDFHGMGESFDDVQGDTFESAFTGRRGENGAITYDDNARTAGFGYAAGIVQQVLRPGIPALGLQYEQGARPDNWRQTWHARAETHPGFAATC